MDLKELREKRAKAAAAIAELQKINADAEHEWSAEDEQRWTGANGDYDKLTGEIEQAERSERATEIQREQTEPVAPPISRDTIPPERETATQSRTVTEEDRSLALQAWARVGQGEDIEDRHREAAELCNINLRARNLTIPLSRNFASQARESRALSATIPSAGAATIPEGFVPRLERALLTFGGMMTVSEIITTTAGEDLPWPTTDDTSNAGEQIGENQEVNEQDVTFGAMVLQAYQWSSKMVKVPFVLLQDSAFNLANLLGDMLGERLARILNTRFTTGTGAGTAYGIIPASTLGKTTDVAAAIDWSEITDLIHSVDPSYRMGAGFMFHDNIALYIRKLVDGEGRSLWLADPNGVAPATLQGYPYTINQDMASTDPPTTATKTMLFGQLSKYKIRMVGSIRLKRLEERYAEFDQIAFLAYMRADGALLDAGTNPVKHMLQT
jgi:HK97 family phage major capsid protein